MACGPTVSDTNLFSFERKRGSCGKTDGFGSVSGRHMAIKFIMANAEAAQQNAVEQGFSVDCEFVYLMCFTTCWPT
ncbi:hypothetical protein F442_03744 [Phytophthora nicotianae P10297]|uniref:Uncharacterized protein n=1 Tax=Phytophthora nicotianae P10297 TaxID=1317064 RepID=W2ZUN9_PHYNI|nr:hypothetical protein F442_03744 [Phytophthora nicotianae P10297]